MLCEQAEALLDFTPEIRPENVETIEISFTSSSAAEDEEKDEHLESVEHLRQIKPPSTPNLSNDKEMSTEAHSFITIPFETLHKLQCFKLQFFNVSKSHLLINLSRIYEHMVTNLGIIFLRRFFEASK
jgi:hypothetical protein